jgi:hypothetical protein
MTLENRRHHFGCFLWVFYVNSCQSVEVLGYSSQNMGKSNGWLWLIIVFPPEANGKRGIYLYMYIYI